MNLTNLSEYWIPKQYSKNQILIHAGDKVGSFYYIKKGYLKVYSISQEGEQRTLLILKPTDLFPLLKDPEQTQHQSLYFYETMTPVASLVIEQEQLLEKIKNNLNDSWSLVRYVSEFSSTLTNRLAQLESKGAEAKLENLFAYLITVCGKPTKLNAYLLDLKLTHQDIASLIGLTRETVSMEIKKLEKQGRVVYRNGFLLIDKRYLEPAI